MSRIKAAEEFHADFMEAREEVCAALKYYCYLYRNASDFRIIRPTENFGDIHRAHHRIIWNAAEDGAINEIHKIHCPASSILSGRDYFFKEMRRWVLAPNLDALKPKAFHNYALIPFSLTGKPFSVWRTFFQDKAYDPMRSRSIPDRKLFLYYRATLNTFTNYAIDIMRTHQHRTPVVETAKRSHNQLEQLIVEKYHLNPGLK